MSNPRPSLLTMMFRQRLSGGLLLGGVIGLIVAGVMYFSEISSAASIEDVRANGEQGQVEINFIEWQEVRQGKRKKTVYYAHATNVSGAKVPGKFEITSGAANGLPVGSTTMLSKLSAEELMDGEAVAAIHAANVVPVRVRGDMVVFPDHQPTARADGTIYISAMVLAVGAGIAGVVLLFRDVRTVQSGEPVLAVLTGFQRKKSQYIYFLEFEKPDGTMGEVTINDRPTLGVVLVGADGRGVVAEAAYKPDVVRAIAEDAGLDMDAIELPDPHNCDDDDAADGAPPATGKRPPAGKKKKKKAGGAPPEAAAGGGRPAPRRGASRAPSSSAPASGRAPAPGGSGRPRATKKTAAAPPPPPGRGTAGKKKAGTARRPGSPPPPPRRRD